jgi:hypothetical protein
MVCVLMSMLISLASCLEIKPDHSVHIYSENIQFCVDADIDMSSTQ